MMMHTRRMTIGASLILAFLACAPSAHAQATAADTRDRNLRAQKVAVITEVMEFTEAEDAAFWPVYREYETELAKINDDRMALIKDYATGYDTLTDATADGLAVRALVAYA